MENFDIKSFIKDEGLEIISDSYTEVVTDSALTVMLRAFYFDPYQPKTYKYIFTLTQLNASDGRTHTRLKCYNKNLLQKQQ